MSHCRRIALVAAILLIVAGGAIVFARWHWTVNNLRAYHEARGWGWGEDREMFRTFLLLDTWVGRGCGAVFFGTSFLSLLFGPAWRRWRYAVYTRIYTCADAQRRRLLWWRVLACLLWLPLPFLVFVVWLAMAWSPSRDALLWPFSEMRIPDWLQGYLCGGGGVLRGTKGPIRLLGRLLWIHPLSNLFIWSLIFATLALAGRVLLGRRRERRSPQYRAAFLKAGRCWKCLYPRVPAAQTDNFPGSNILACPECGEPYQEQIPGPGVTA